MSHLSQIDTTNPLARKLLVAPDIAWGWETIVALARLRRGIVGWEATTLLGLAEDLAFTEMDQRGLRRASDVDLTTLVDRALAASCASAAVGSSFAALASGLGFRRAVKDAVLTLRAAGVSAERAQSSVERHSPTWDAAAVLVAFERLLTESSLLDPAGLLRLAIEQFDEEARYVLDGHTLLAAELAPSGLARTLMEKLVAAGATPLPEPLSRHSTEPARTSAQEFDLFVASSPSTELLEVLRRVVQEGRRWDDVEIVTTDRDTYGIALDALCQREGIPCTLLDGVPLARTRVGRAAERWLRWLEDGLPARLLREGIEAGDISGAIRAESEELRSEGAPLGPPLSALSSQLSTSVEKIGWGRARYEDACARLRSGRFNRPLHQHDDESGEQFARRTDQRRQEETRLLILLEGILAVTPPVPELGTQHDVMSSCAQLAATLRSLLALLPLESDADRRAAGHLTERLAELAEGDDTDVRFSLAMAELRDGISDLRAWTEASRAERPRYSSGGAIHLTDIKHGGTTGRPRVFVVGLDADRAGGSRAQDPILPDAARRLIGADLLPLTADRREERRWQLSAMLARVTGRLTLSLSTDADGAGNTVNPAHAVLEVFRQQQDNESLGYKKLHESLGEPCCAVPRPESSFGTRGVWLSAIAGGAHDYRNGTQLVRSAWPLLDAGLTAAIAREGDAFTAWHGLVTAAAGRLDPRESTTPISATSLELLSSCPLAWFYHYGLGLRPPDAQEYDSECWLSPLQRGSLLHSVYERLARDYKGRQQALLEDAARIAALAIADALLAEYRDEVIPPSLAVYETEAREIRASALAFLEGERKHAREGRTSWVDFELPFPRKASVRFPVGEGSIPVKGFIDRVDRTQDGRLVVIDYKTGSPGRYQKDKRAGPFNGGRHLQPAIYAAAAHQEVIGEVARFEYRFPTERGENEDVRYDAAELAAAGGIVAGLMRHVEQGEFPPTTDVHDCTYCDYAPVCRASSDGRKTVSPRAAWAELHGESLEQYRDMIARRGGDA
ncbi:MAG TPA: PD-(D/E)XK nuclease family protein [Gemmatimonadales bacterium]|jgi:ATP-dependent helicase/nuclease subunit B